MNIHLIASVFAIIFVAELPDKTALASLVLATRHKPLPVFIGASLGLTVQSVVAVGAGHLLGLLPQRLVHFIAGLLFLGSAAVMWMRSSEVKEARRGSPEAGFSRVLGKVFVVVFIAEWGDLTQVGTAGLAARYAAPFSVFTGATLALWSVVAIAVFVGHRAARVLDPEVTKRVAAVVFALVGVALLAGWL
jgi:putative Ca2+/H+ antiporter (TMEM165/GDT1 family)